MKDEEKSVDNISNETLAKIIRQIAREDPELFKKIVKSIPNSAAYFKERWEEDFGTIVDISTFTDEQIIDATFAINQIRMSEISKEDRIKEVAKILRIKPQLLN